MIKNWDITTQKNTAVLIYPNTFSLISILRRMGVILDLRAVAFTHLMASCSTTDKKGVPYGEQYLQYSKDDDS